jgi:hypothetical protein
MEQSTELKNIALRIYEALSGRNFSLIERYLSQQDGVLSIGTDPNEWWEGYPTIAKVIKAQMETGVITLNAGALQAYSEGSVGWVADRPKFKLPDGTEIPVRMTSVFHKEGNDWKMVLSHISVGVRNEDAFGETLPT